MFYYEGLSCPVCQKTFVADEDIVVCPQCGLPHHRSCWKSIGKCYADDRHGTEQQWRRDQANHENQKGATSEQICPHCHAANVKYAEFCTRCGHGLTTEDWHSAEPKAPYVGEYSPYGQPHESYSATERIADTSVADLAAVVGNNQGYYIDRFRRIERTGNGGWNWAAFLLSPIWLFYRKQYKLGTLFFILQLLTNIATSIVYAPVQAAQTNAAAEAALMEVIDNPMFWPVAALSFIMMALQILLGVRANHFYLQHCKNKIAAERSKVPDLSSFELSSIGGVSVGAAVVIYIVSSLLLNVVLLFIDFIAK